MKKTMKIIIIVLLSVLFIYVCLLCKPKTFTTTNYVLTSVKATVPIRIAHLSDVHNREYGKDNQGLIEAVAAADPDAIFITGDSVSSKDEDVTPAVSLVERLAKIAPVFFSYGNHDLNNDALYNRNLGDMFEEAGATVLDFEYEDIEIKNQKIRIGGFYGFGFGKSYIETGDVKPEEYNFLKDFQDTARYTMLLAHLPVVWLEYNGLEDWDIDCIFSGHSHGGQIVLPILGPVIAPDQGWFPDRVSGHFTAETGKTQVIVSRGLGDSVKVPRINNEPELVVVDVVPE
ncbi:MAG: hypothetical protein E7253_08830 [Lachnospiraceae bacterium]|nr:hypothetical protein [Lachnospiraceae bacterium]